MLYGLKRDEIILLSVVATLLCLGLLMVFNASSIKAFNAYGQSSHYLLRQFIFAILGGVALLACAHFDYHWWSKLTLLLVGLSIALLALVLLPGFGVNIKGATRWIKTPLFNLQVSEFCKLSFVIYLSAYLAKRNGKLNDFKRDFLPPWIILGVVIALLMLEPDFGSSVVLGALTFVLLFVAGARFKHLGFFFLLGVAGIVAAIAGRGYRMDRVTSFLDVNGHGVSYQLQQSLIAYGAGGVHGVGVGNSVQKMLYLPESYTDFVVAVWGEEFGFIGVVALVVLIAALFGIGIKISRSAPDRLGAILAFGLTLFLVLQMTINFWVTLGLLPTKGLTFPFLSYGGSSLCVSLAAVGVLLNVSRQTR